MNPFKMILALFPAVTLSIAACGGGGGGISAASSAPPVAPSTAAASATPSAYTVDAGWGGTACLLPSAAVENLFGPLAADNYAIGSPAGNSPPAADVRMGSGNDVNGDPRCTEDWVPVDSNPNGTDSQMIIIVSNGSWPLNNELADFRVHKIKDGLPAEVYGTGEASADTAGFYVAAVPLSGGSYVEISNFTSDSSILTRAQATAALHVIVPLAIKYPPQGLRLGDLP